MLNNIVPVTKNPPVGSPLRGDAQVEFRVTAGDGKAAPDIQTTETDGYYSTRVKLGDTPGPNIVFAIGTVTAAVPSWDVSGNITRTDKSLGSYFPMELWGLKITVPENKRIMLNSEGYLTKDILFD